MSSPSSSLLRLGLVRRGWTAVARLGQARLGTAGRVAAWHSRQRLTGIGAARHGIAWQGRQGMASRVAASPGKAFMGGLGVVGRATAWHGTEWHSRRGGATQGEAGHGPAGQTWTERKADVD